MKTYWDYSEKERSLMTREDVSNLLDTELMTKGVKKVIAPVLKPIKDVKIETETWFEVDGTFFKSAEQAQSFLALDPRKSTYEYSCGYDYHYACELDPKIEQKQLYSRQALLNLSTILKENKASKEYNEKVTNEYEKQMKEVNNVLSEVWEDYYACQEKAAKHQAVITTRNEYLTLTKQDKALAETFLSKVYSQKEIQEADKWFGEEEANA